MVDEQSDELNEYTEYKHDQDTHIIKKQNRKTLPMQ